MTLVWGILLAALGTIRWGPLLEAGLTIAAITLGILLGLIPSGVSVSASNLYWRTYWNVCRIRRNSLRPLSHAALVDLVRTLQRHGDFFLRRHVSLATSEVPSLSGIGFSLCGFRPTTNSSMSDLSLRNA